MQTSSEFKLPEFPILALCLYPNTNEAPQKVTVLGFQQYHPSSKLILIDTKEFGLLNIFWFEIPSSITIPDDCQNDILSSALFSLYFEKAFSFNTKNPLTEFDGKEIKNSLIQNKKTPR